MDFYFDENIPESIVQALKLLNAVEYRNEHQIFLTKEIWGAGAADEIIFPGVAEKNGIIVTNDLKIPRKETQRFLIHNFPIGVFFIHFVSGCSFWMRCEILIKQWPNIVKQARRSQGGKPYAFVLKNAKLEPL